MEWPTETNLTVGKSLSNYLEHRKPYIVERHYTTLEARKKQIETFFGVNTEVRSITEERIREFCLDLVEEGDSPPTVNKKMGLLKAALEKAVADKKIARNPVAGIERLSDARPPAWRFLSEEEVERLLKALRAGRVQKVERRRKGKVEIYEVKVAPNPHLHRLVLFLLNTGARVGEALALRWDDLNFVRGVVSLHTTKRAARGKTAKPRYIPMNAAVRELLKDMEPEGIYVFCYPNNLNRDLNRAWRTANPENPEGAGHLRPHDLRHTFASGLAMGGVPLNTIRDLLGHTTMTMTLRYAHLSPSVTAEAVETLNYGAPLSEARIVAIGESAG